MFARAGDRAYHVLVHDPITVLVVHVDTRELTIATVYEPDPILHRDFERAFSFPAALLIEFAAPQAPQ